MRQAATGRLALIQGTIMFLPLLGFALIFASTQEGSPVPAPVPVPSERYEQAMRCAGVMAANMPR